MKKIISLIIAIAFIVTTNSVYMFVSAESEKSISIGMNGLDITDDELAELIRNDRIPQNVISLSLSQNLITDVTLFSTFKNLKRLNLYLNLIDDPTPLIQLTELEWLNLNENPISLEQIELLRVALPNCEIIYTQKRHTSSIVGYSRDFSNQGITNERLAEMVESGEIPDVAILNLNNNQISDISPLAGFTHLQLLELENNPISDITQLKLLKKLRRLYLGNTKISHEDIAELEMSLPSCLSLPRCTINYKIPITNEKLAEMVASGEIPKDVEELNLSNQEISDITPLASLTKIQRLDLSNNQISDLTPLAGLTNLGGSYGALGLANNQITDVTPLSRLTKLQWLDLSNNQISDLTPLQSLTNMTFMTLKGNPVTDEQINELYEHMRNFKFLVGHILGGEEITIFDALEILKYLVGMESILDENMFAFYAACITGGDEPTIFDALEILKELVGMESALN